LVDEPEAVAVVAEVAVGEEHTHKAYEPELAGEEVVSKQA
jgi:hypothetical protein